MLVYKRKGKIDARLPPPEIAARVEAENTGFEAELDERARK